MKNIKKNIRSLFPKLGETYDELRLRIKDKPAKSVFENIYRNNSWESGESISGPGSDIKNTVNFHKSLIKLLEEFGIKIMLDAPCGDFNWMKELNLPVEKYTGADIVGDIIERNKILYGSDSKIFLELDIIQDRLPESDLILCRDCMVHLSYSRIRKALKNFKKSGSEYLLITYFKNIEKNINIETGMWRKLNFNMEPFNFPEPIASIFENCPDEGTNGEWSSDKYLGLWKLKDLKI